MAKVSKYHQIIDIRLRAKQYQIIGFVDANFWEQGTVFQHIARGFEYTHAGGLLE